MVKLARRSLASSERVHSYGPTPQVRSSGSVMRWKAASRSRSETSTARPDARERLPAGSRASLLHTRIELARGEFDRAHDALAVCAPTTMRERIDVAVLSARVAHGRRSDATDLLLAEALSLAKTEGFVLAVADDLVELRPRVSLLFRSRRIEQYEQAVLDRLERDPNVPHQSGSTSGPLSARELTVVRYLASRLTYKEIAAELFVSTNTLKTHVQRSYQKLGVSSRTQAVAEARRLGLF